MVFYFLIICCLVLGIMCVLVLLCGIVVVGEACGGSCIVTFRSVFSTLRNV